MTATLAGDDWRIEETGPLRVRARLDGRLGTSRVRLTVSLMPRRAGAARSSSR